MKRLLLLLLTLMSVQIGYSQRFSANPLPLHLEVGVGTGFGLDRVGYDNNLFIKSARAELFFDSLRMPISFGIGVQIMRIDRAYGNPKKTAPYAAMQMYLLGNYNWRINDKLVLYSGMASGVSHGFMDFSFQSYPDGAYHPKEWSLYFAPQVGIEAWRHLCFRLSCNLMDKGYSFVGFDISFRF